MATATIFERANLMAQTEVNGNKFSMSYPLLTIVLTVVLYLTGHLGFSIWWMATMQANVNFTNAELVKVATTDAEARKTIQMELDTQKIYIDTLRERIVKAETQLETRRR